MTVTTSPTKTIGALSSSSTICLELLVVLGTKEVESLHHQWVLRLRIDCEVVPVIAQFFIARWQRRWRCSSFDNLCFLDDLRGSLLFLSTWCSLDLKLLALLPQPVHVFQHHRTGPLVSMGTNHGIATFAHEHVEAAEGESGYQNTESVTWPTHKGNWQR